MTQQAKAAKAIRQSAKTIGAKLETIARIAEGLDGDDDGLKILPVMAHNLDRMIEQLGKMFDSVRSPGPSPLDN